MLLRGAGNRVLKEWRRQKHSAGYNSDHSERVVPQTPVGTTTDGAGVGHSSLLLGAAWDTSILPHSAQRLLPANMHRFHCFCTEVNVSVLFFQELFSRALLLLFLSAICGCSGFIRAVLMPCDSTHTCLVTPPTTCPTHNGCQQRMCTEYKNPCQGAESYPERMDICKVATCPSRAQSNYALSFRLSAFVMVQ